MPQETAFIELKKRLMTRSVLAHPDVEAAQNGERPHIIYFEVSRTGLGAVLLQQGLDGFLHSIYFAS